MELPLEMVSKHAFLYLYLPDYVNRYMIGIIFIVIFVTSRLTKSVYTGRYVYSAIVMKFCIIPNLSFVLKTRYITTIATYLNNALITFCELVFDHVVVEIFNSLLILANSVQLVQHGLIYFSFRFPCREVLLTFLILFDSRGEFIIFRAVIGFCWRGTSLSGLCYFACRKICSILPSFASYRFIFSGCGNRGFSLWFVIGV